MPRGLENITDRNWRSFILQPGAVLVLSISTCDRCSAWEEELSDWIGNATLPSTLRLGRLVLDSPEVSEFKRSNDWLDMVDGVPFTAIFASGVPLTSFSGTGIERLERRLSRHLNGSPLPPHPHTALAAR